MSTLTLMRSCAVFPEDGLLTAEVRDLIATRIGRRLPNPREFCGMKAGSFGVVIRISSGFTTEDVPEALPEDVDEKPVTELVGNVHRLYAESVQMRDAKQRALHTLASARRRDSDTSDDDEERALARSETMVYTPARPGYMSVIRPTSEESRARVKPHPYCSYAVIVGRVAKMCEGDDAKGTDCPIPAGTGITVCMPFRPAVYLSCPSDFASSHTMQSSWLSAVARQLRIPRACIKMTIEWKFPFMTYQHEADDVCVRVRKPYACVRVPNERCVRNLEGLVESGKVPFSTREYGFRAVVCKRHDCWTQMLVSYSLSLNRGLYIPPGCWMWDRRSTWRDLHMVMYNIKKFGDDGGGRVELDESSVMDILLSEDGEMKSPDNGKPDGSRDEDFINIWSMTAGITGGQFGAAGNVPFRIVLVVDPDCDGARAAQWREVVRRHNGDRPIVYDMTIEQGSQTAMCILRCQSERELLLTRMELIQIICPDIVVGYNTSGWDYPFIWERLKKYIPQLAAAENSARREHAVKATDDRNVFRGIQRYAFSQIVAEIGDSNEMVKCLMNGHAIFMPIPFVCGLTKFGSPMCAPDPSMASENIDLYTLIRLERQGWDSFSLDNVAQRVLKGKNISKVKLDMPAYRRRLLESVVTTLQSDATLAALHPPPGTSSDEESEEAFALGSSWADEVFKWCANVRVSCAERTRAGGDCSGLLKSVTDLKVLCDTRDNYGALFRLYESRDVENVLACCLYAAVDCDLVLRIFIGEAMFSYVCAISALTGLKINRVAQGTQQDRVMSGLLSMCNRQGFSTDYVDVPNPASYEGAYVFPPVAGFYNAVVCLDFAHLYPSIIESYCLCYTTYVPTREEAERLRSEGLVVNEVVVDREKDYRTYWAQDPEAPLPQLCILYQQERDRNKKLKKKYTQAGDLVSAQKADSTQLANKAMTNSIYGFTGTDKSKGGKIPLKALAASVTGKGREMILTTQREIEEKWRDILTGATALPDSMYPEHMPKPPLPPREWVELIETMRVVYGDTDSVMIAMHGRSRSPAGGVFDAEHAEDREAMNMFGNVLAYWCTHCFNKGVELEKEYMGRGCFIKGKTYVMQEWTSVEGDMVLVRKGMKAIKRDSCGIERSVHACLEHALFAKHSLEEVCGALRGAMSVLLRPRSYAWSEEELMEHFASTMMVANARNADGNWKNDFYVTRHLDPLLVPSIGDRIHFVTCDVRSIRAAEKNFPISKVIEERLRPDMVKYFDKAQTIVSQFSSVVERWSGLDQWMANLHRDIVHVQTGQRSLSALLRCKGPPAAIPAAKKRRVKVKNG